MSRKTIAIDIDDVLAIHAEAFVAFSNKHWGTNLTVDDYDEDWAKMWKIAYGPEHTERAAEWRKSHENSNKRVNGEAISALQKLAERFDLVVATSRRLSMKEDTLSWINLHFKGIFKDVHFSGIWDGEYHNGMAAMTKAEIIQNIGADYLIDDQPKHVFAVAEAGLKGILFGDYGWSRDVAIPKNVTRCRDWAAVLEYFEGEESNVLA